MKLLLFFFLKDNISLQYMLALNIVKETVITLFILQNGKRPLALWFFS